LTSLDKDDYADSILIVFYELELCCIDSSEELIFVYICKEVNLVIDRRAIIKQYLLARCEVMKMFF
jgi:hypothetical protein